MTTLVAFYSKTGNTKKIGQKIAKIIKADVDEIIDKKEKKGAMGFIQGGFKAFFNKLTEIEYKKNPSNYDIVMLGTPIWAGCLTPAVRTYLKNNNLKKVAFFCSCGDKQTKAFKQMEELSNKPIATLELKEKLIESSEGKIKEFCNKIVGI